jgi:ring-1,2-phenylacetyl-CoA epoxidase subunit PaaD
VVALDEVPATRALEDTALGGRSRSSDRARADGYRSRDLDSDSHGRQDSYRDDEVWSLLASIPDPEIPVLTLCDLGIVRHVRWVDTSDGAQQILHVGITPTYSGCPATEMIRQAVRSTLDRAGHVDAVIDEVLFPPWTSDWLTVAGREKLRSFGIAPPQSSVSSPRQLFNSTKVPCPRCASTTTERLSEFGSTPCKAHYRCRSCLEPFDYFKCL